MPSKDNPLNGVTFLNKRGFCLECDRKITTGIFCTKCQPYFPDKTITVVNMEEGQPLYVSPGAIFEAEGMLWILASAVLSEEKDIYFTTKIRKIKNAIELDLNTIDRDEIYFGWPDYDQKISCFLVHPSNSF